MCSEYIHDAGSPSVASEAQLVCYGALLMEWPLPIDRMALTLLAFRHWGQDLIGLTPDG